MEPNVYVPHTTPVVSAAICKHGYARGHTLHTLPAKLAYQESPDYWRDVNRIALGLADGWGDADGLTFFNHTPRQIYAALQQPGPLLVRLNVRYRLLTVSSACFAGSWAFSIGLDSDAQVQDLCE